MKPLAVIDIDGVVADVTHRLHHLSARPKDWGSFFAAAVDDPPLDEGVRRVRALRADHDVVYLTGRPEWLRSDTERWLAAHDISGVALHMRRRDDRRPARQTKAELLRRIAAGRDVTVVLDDDPEVVAALQADGWPAELATWLPHSKTLHQAQEAEGRS